jgi:hypothetical protein
MSRTFINHRTYPQEYLSVQLDGPFLLAPINCAMFKTMARIISCGDRKKPVRPKGPKGKGRPAAGPFLPSVY